MAFLAIFIFFSTNFSAQASGLAPNAALPPRLLAPDLPGGGVGWQRYGLDVLPFEKVDFIVSNLEGNVEEVAKHVYGVKLPIPQPPTHTAFCMCFFM